MLPSSVPFLREAPGHAFLQLDAYRDNHSIPRVQGATEVEKIPRKEGEIQERNGSCIIDGTS